jgi:uncharacterized protein
MVVPSKGVAIASNSHFFVMSIGGDSWFGGMMQKTIEHHPREHRFTVATGGEPAVLEYRLLNPTSTSDPGGVDFTYTYVPSAYRGQGIAEAMVRHGFRWAKDQGFQVQASCWYAAKFLR